MLTKSNYFVLAALLTAAAAFGQVPQTPVAQAPAVLAAPSIRPDYALGPNDQILVRSNAEELNDRPFRVAADGFITFPLVNRVQVSGMTVQALEADLVNRLRQFFVQPTVGITITGFRSEPVSFFGAFLRPGVLPLTGGRTLLEMLAAVGGFQPNATRRIRVTRRAEYGAIPLPSAIQDPVTGTSTVEISLDTLLSEINPAEDIVLEAYDRVTVDLAPPVYVNGEVAKPAAIPLIGQESMTVMQALAQAGGFTATSKRSNINVLRPVAGTGRLAQIEINIQRIMEGKDNDFPLFPNDILYVGRISMLEQLLPQILTGLVNNAPFVIVTATR